MNTFLTAYYHNWFLISDLYEQFAKRHELSSSALFLLQELSRGTFTQRELCRKLVLPKQTVHSILKVFLANDWITLEISSNDKRKRLIALTTLGIQHSTPLLETLHQIEHCALAQMPPEERESMITSYRHFAECLQQAMHTTEEASR